MTRPLLIRFTGLVLSTLAVTGFVSVAAAESARPSGIEASPAPTADDLPPKSPVTQPTTTTAPPATTTTVAPTTTTTAPPVTAPPVTAPPTTVAPPPPTPAPEPIPVPAPVPAPVPVPSMNACEADLLHRMNEARGANGASALVADGAIDHISKSWAHQLMTSGNLAHNPGYAGAVFAARPEATTVAENVGRSAGSVSGVFDSFMQSSGHRAAILAHAHTHAAVGCTTDALGQHWVAINFWG